MWLRDKRMFSQDGGRTFGNIPIHLEMRSRGTRTAGGSMPYAAKSPVTGLAVAFVCVFEAPMTQFLTKMQRHGGR
jgi:hypothetical protein